MSGTDKEMDNFEGIIRMYNLCKERFKNVFCVKTDNILQNSDCKEIYIVKFIDGNKIEDVLFTVHIGDCKGIYVTDCFSEYINDKIIKFKC